MEVNITKDNFEQEVLNSPVPVLIDFWAAWCGPCRMQAPVLEEIARDFEGIVKIGKVNVDQQPELSAQFNITAIPSLLLVKEGKVDNLAVGYRSKEELIKMLGL